jgi:hypothetical protein
MSEGLLTVHAVLVLEGCQEDDTPKTYKEVYHGLSGGLFARAKVLAEEMRAEGFEDVCARYALVGEEMQHLIPEA